MILYAPKTYLTIVLDESGSMYGGNYGNYGRKEDCGVWGPVILSAQELVDRLAGQLKPEHGEILVRLTTFGDCLYEGSAKEHFTWTPVQDVGQRIDQQVGPSYGGGGSTPTIDGLWDAIESVMDVNDGDGMELEAASIVCFLTDGGENSSRHTDEEIKPRIEALQDSGQWSFVGMFVTPYDDRYQSGAETTRHVVKQRQQNAADHNLENSCIRWGIDPDLCRAFLSSNVSGQWSHFADQIISYVEHRADGRVGATDDLTEEGE